MDRKQIQLYVSMSKELYNNRQEDEDYFIGPNLNCNEKYSMKSKVNWKEKYFVVTKKRTLFEFIFLCIFSPLFFIFAGLSVFNGTSTLYFIFAIGVAALCIVYGSFSFLIDQVIIKNESTFIDNLKEVFLYSSIMREHLDLLKVKIEIIIVFILCGIMITTPIIYIAITPSYMELFDQGFHKTKEHMPLDMAYTLIFSTCTSYIIIIVYQIQLYIYKSKELSRKLQEYEELGVSETE